MQRNVWRYEAHTRMHTDTQAYTYRHTCMHIGRGRRIDVHRAGHTTPRGKEEERDRGVHV